MKSESIKNYWIYFVASTLSLIGSNFFLFLNGWYLLEQTGQKLSVGISWTLFFLPGAILLPIVGRLFDSYSLKKVILSFEGGKVLVLSIFVACSHLFPSAIWVYVAAVLYGMMFVAYFPSVYVVVKRLIPSELQLKYSHLSEISLQISNIVSVVVSGYLYELLGFTTLMTVAVGLLFVAFTSMLLCQLPQSAVVKTSSLKNLARDSYTDVWKLFKTNKTDARFLFGCLHLFPHALLMVSNVPLLILIHQAYDGNAVAFGWIDGSIGAVGMLLSFVLARYHLKFSQAGTSSIVAIGAAVILMSIYFLPSTKLAVALWVPLYGAAVILTKVLARGEVLEQTSKELIGRASSLFQMLGYIMMMFLLGVINVLSDSLSSEAMFVFLGVGMFVYAIIGQTLMTKARSTAEVTDEGARHAA